MLIQRVPGYAEYFFVCYLGSHGTTACEKQHVDIVAMTIAEHSDTGELEVFGLLTRAIEGKAFGKY